MLDLAVNEALRFLETANSAQLHQTRSTLLVLQQHAVSPEITNAIKSCLRLLDEALDTRIGRQRLN